MSVSEHLSVGEARTRGEGVGGPSLPKRIGAAKRRDGWMDGRMELARWNILRVRD